MSMGGKVYRYLDCGCAIMTDGARVWCPSCSDNMLVDGKAKVAGAVAKVLRMVTQELERSGKAFPAWPADPVHSAGIVVEEAGEAMRASLQHWYGTAPKTDAIRAELVQCAAVCFRALLFMEEHALPQQKDSAADPWKDLSGQSGSLAK